MRYRDKMPDTKRLALLGLSVSIALILSYIEFLLPPIFSAVPGIKLGLANIITVYLLFSISARDAAIVSTVRVILSSLLFGTALTFIYSLAGAVLSLVTMIILKRIDFFSAVGVSIAGAVMHNVGQILTAILVLRTAEIGYYLIVLTLTGILSGVFVGILGASLVKYIKIDWRTKK